MRFAATAGILLSSVTSPSTQEQLPVFRVGTELVQTDVMVFDRDGLFVNGLRAENFELRIDGKLKPVRFFERVVAGTANEESQLNAAGGVVSPDASGALARPSLYRGRTILFYIDDLHLDLGALNATQKLIGEFIEEEMSQDDEVAVASATGQIGFLQQLTDNKTVLRTALQRIKLRPNSIRDLDRPPMTEYQALLIDKYDHEVTAFFVRETIRNNPGITATQAENVVRGRSRFLLQQAAQLTANTLSGLENLIRSSSRQPGRKVVFFASGGFLLDNSGRSNHLHRITNVAARTGTVIYSLDARGLVGGLTDASTAAAELSAGLARVSLGELTATQDGLSALARDTGGRPILNTNALGTAVSRVLEETSTYYLLAWEPDQDAPKSRAFRNLEVKLVGRPDLTVRVRRGFFDVDPAPPAAEKVTEAKAPRTPSEAQLHEAIGSPNPQGTTPISLSVNHLLTTDHGMRVTVSIHIPNAFISFHPEDAQQKAAVRVAGIVFNDRGQGDTYFDEVLNLDRDSADARKGSGETVSQQLSLTPGLYLVQVGVRDERSGRIASARSWVDIPNLAGGQLALSSLNIGARRFQRDSTMRFFLFTYNAARARDSKPDLAVQVQLLRENRTIIRTAFKKLAVEDGDVDRVPYAAELSLADLPAGRYVLSATVIDRVSGASASQQTRFEIE